MHIFGSPENLINKELDVLVREFLVRLDNCSQISLHQLKILRLLQHENIIEVKSIQLPISRSDFNDLYLICELMETDLTTIIKSD